MSQQRLAVSAWFRDAESPLWFWLALILTLALKIWVLSTYGHMQLGDNGGFLDAAKVILSGTDWLHETALESDPFPPTLWRPIGYSLVIAGTQLALGEYWAISLSIAQAALSLGVGLMVYRLARTLKLSVLTASIVFLLYECSVPVSTDPLIMEDAMTGSLGAIGFILVLQSLAEGRRPSLALLLSVGILAAICFTIRDVYHFVMPVIAAGAGILFLLVGDRRSAVLAPIALALPVFLVAFGLQSWNEHRTGHAVSASAAQSAYLYGALRAAYFDPDILAGDGVYLETVRALNQNFDYTDTRRINEVLFYEHGLNSVEQMKLGSDLFWGTILTHPVAYLRAGLRRLLPLQQATLFAGPVTRVDDLDWWAGGATEAGFRVGWRAEAQAFRQSMDPSDLTPRVVWHLGIRAASRAVGAVLLVLFLVGAPLYWLRNRIAHPQAATVVGLSWIIYCLWLAMYLPISFEVRYLSPVIAPAILSMVVLLGNLWPPARKKLSVLVGNKSATPGN